MPLAAADTDWRAFRAGLVRSEAAAAAPPAVGAALVGGDAGAPARASSEWAHPIALPEEGCVLLAHPQMFTDGQQKYFHQAVIFLFDHSKEGSAGIILNRKTSYTMGAVSTEARDAGFADCPLYLGGDVGKDTIHMLHPHVGVEGSAEVVRGVRMGGFEGASAAVAEGTPATDFRWFVRYCGWGPGQLEKEVGLNVWILAAASPEVILGETEGNKWAEVLSLLGEDYAQMARAHETDNVAEDGGDSGDGARRL